MKKEDKKILSELKNKLVNELNDEIHEIILFGSHILNKDNDESDIDVLIVLKSTYNWKKKRMIRDVCYDIGLKYDVLIDSKIISNYELNNTPIGIHPLYKDAIENGIRA
jgi:predicted nucleotidyltransferase